MTAFDPKDPQFQVSPEFPPDKETAWHYPPEQDGWMLAHNALRDEVAGLKKALEALKARGGITQAWELKALGEAADAHLVHIHAHHANEDKIFMPYMLKRAKYPEKLSTDHEGIVKQLAEIEALVKGLKVGDSVDPLLAKMTEYETDLLPHLKEEEDIGLPLVRAYFAPQDMKPVIGEIVKHSPKVEMGSLVQSAGPEFFRKTFMANEGIPFFVWYIDFYWKYRAFVRLFTNNINALVDNKEKK